MSTGRWGKKRDPWQRVQSARWYKREITPPLQLQVKATTTPLYRSENGMAYQNIQPPRVYNPQLQALALNPFGTPNMPQSETQPRSFEDLHTERSYLLSLLQNENFRATDLLRKIPPLEQSLELAQIPHVRTKTKKRLGWLRYRLDEITRQEKAILSRLGEITYEIQSRERWYQIENEQRQQEQQIHNHVALCRSLEALQINAGVSAFQPQWKPPVANASFNQQQPGYGIGYDWQPSIPVYAPEPAPIHSHVSELAAQTHDRNDDLAMKKSVETQTLGLRKARRPAVLRRSSSMDNIELDTETANAMCETASRTKRNSMPTSLLGILYVWEIEEDQ